MANKISYYMEMKGISQSELARKLKIDRSHLNRVINGKSRPSTALLERIAAILDCSVKDFF